MSVETNDNKQINISVECLGSSNLFHDIISSNSGDDIVVPFPQQYNEVF